MFKYRWQCVFIFLYFFLIVILFHCTENTFWQFPFHVIVELWFYGWISVLWLICPWLSTSVQILIQAHISESQILFLSWFSQCGPWNDLLFKLINRQSIEERKKCSFNFSKKDIFVLEFLTPSFGWRKKREIWKYFLWKHPQ